MIQFYKDYSKGSNNPNLDRIIKASEKRSNHFKKTTQILISTTTSILLGECLPSCIEYTYETSVDPMKIDISESIAELEIDFKDTTLTVYQLEPQSFSEILCKNLTMKAKMYPLQSIFF